MSQYAFDPVEWLTSATRALEDYVRNALGDDDVQVEMSFPNTDTITKETPLAKVLIHFEQDNIENPVLGFGVPGKEVVDVDEGSWALYEAAWHEINFDVGVWVSAEMGGATKRMQVYQQLVTMFGTALGRIDLNETTGGVKVVNFHGGRFALDRVNDLPIWRAMEMTLICQVFSKHIPPQIEVLPIDGADQTQIITIDGDVPVT